MKNKFLLTLAFCFVFTFTFFAQNLKKDVVRVSKSNVIKKLNELRVKKPQISAKKLADFGNVLLSQKGYEFTFAAEQGKTLVNNVEVDSDAFEIYKFTQLDGKNRLFATQNHGSHPCGTFTGLPVTNLSEKQMSILADGKSFRVMIPKDLIFDDIELVEKNLKKTVRRWFTPLDATPEAISNDGKTIYISTEIESLLLGIAENGTLNFIPANDKNIIKRNTEIKNFPKDSKNDYLGYKKFSDGKQTFFVKFSYPCT